MTYKLVSNECPSNYSIAKVNVLHQGVGGVMPVGRKVADNTIQTPTRIAVYPNPSNGIFNIDLTNVAEEYDTVEVFNMLGSRVYQGRLTPKNFNSIDLSSMTTGCYLAKATGKSGSTSFQLIKQ